MLYLIDLVLREPKTDAEKNDDNYNPLNIKSIDYLGRIHNGIRKISVDDAKTIRRLFSKINFVGQLYELEDERKVDLLDALKNKGVKGVKFDNVDEVCAELCYKLICAMADGTNGISLDEPILVDGYGQRFQEIPTGSSYVKDGKIHIGTEVIPLPEKLVPEKDIAPKELPYTNALCEAYGDALGYAVGLDTMESVPGRYKKHFEAQRNNFYDADWLYHSAEQIFGNGETVFYDLEMDEFKGIESTYYRDYVNGYERLLAVPDKSVSIPLDTSPLIQLRNLVKSSHRMGICHRMVNDKLISSWVDIDE